MKQILLVVSLACTMALVRSDCFFADPCGALPGSRVDCGPAGISKFHCLWLGCCYEESPVPLCIEKQSICETTFPSVADMCPGQSTTRTGHGPCILDPGQTCGVGTMREDWDCYQDDGTSAPASFNRCCCDTSCSGANRCDIPSADRTACVEGSANIDTQADCFAAHCCFEDGATIPCFEPNIPPKTTCDMVFPGCETP